MLDIVEFINKKIKRLPSDKKSMEIKLDILKRLVIYISNNEVSGQLDKVIKLTDMRMGYSEYRVINDCESDNKELWVEYIDGDENIRLNFGDLLIKMK